MLNPTQSIDKTEARVCGRRLELNEQGHALLHLLATHAEQWVPMKAVFVDGLGVADNIASMPVLSAVKHDIQNEILAAAPQLKMIIKREKGKRAMLKMDPRQVAIAEPFESR